ncbi:B-cell antigen receptor complex-associated protein beta chain [Trichomycterus rosablanca]|uniref:B-cell antigen receptor complex-associated protein beta chain n=1 Tax=Trichomycterus rosablanca TaxID=2290929 RepID=UPI002F35F73B
MHYMFLTCSLMVLVNLSGAALKLQVQQKPRYYGVKVGRQVGFICSNTGPLQDSLEVEWYKVKAFEERTKVLSDRGHPFTNPRAIKNKGHLIINKVEAEDSGIYFCKINKTWGFGTELQVFRRTDLSASEWRSNMKDMIIVLQGLLLVLCIVLPLVRFFTLENKEEVVYEEPVEDHTYEGLEIEHCGDLYEDLTAYSQIPETDAPWQVESPDEE